MTHAATNVVTQARGYADPAYIRTLDRWGSVRELPASGGWILERDVPGSARRDAMGAYPIFSCTDWTALPADLAGLAEDLVSLVVVVDPFAAVDEPFLRSAFDHVVPFKEHFVADLASPVEAIVSSGRFREARRALLDVRIDVPEDLDECAREWLALHKPFAERKQVSGLRLTTESGLRSLLRMPGVVVLRARLGDETVGMHIEVCAGPVVYGHLATYSEAGRACGASAALHLWEIEYFRGMARWIDWGGAAGATPAASDPLANFKRGFSNSRRTAYLCGKVLDPVEYARLERARKDGARGYFPSYRAGEFS